METVRGTILMEVPALIESLGGDAEAFFDAHDIPITSAGEFDHFVPYHRVSALIGGAARALSCPDFGMRLAALQQTRMLGPIAVIVRNSVTIRAAVKDASRYLHVLAPSDSIELRCQGKDATVAFETNVVDPSDRYQMVERGLGTMVIAFRLMAGPIFTPRRVTFMHERIASQDAYRTALGCPVDFRRDINAIHVPASLLDRQISNRDPFAHDLAEDFLRSSRLHESITDAVESLVRKLMPVGPVTLGAAARALSLHPRALQRQLAAHHTTFDRIHDDVRRDVAWELSSAGLPAERIARALGYTEQSTFTRACRRWFGETPRSLRQRTSGP